MNTERREIRLPEDVYETLHFAALAFGGVGRGQDFDYDVDATCPVCIHGLAIAADNASSMFTSRLDAVLLGVGIRRGENDNAVRCINRRENRVDSQRVSWEEWCEELNVVPDTHSGVSSTEDQ